MKTPEKLLSIVIVSYNTREVLRECLERVEKYVSSEDSEVFVVDNASSDGSARMTAESFPGVKLIGSEKNVGFAAGNNLALRKASGKYILLLNSDAFLLENTLEPTIRFMEENPDCGVLGIRLAGRDGKLQPSARKLPDAWNKFLVVTGIASRFPRSKFLGGTDFSWWDHAEVREVGWVPGAYFLTRKEVIDRIGLLDERYFLYYEETDFCLSAKRAGWKVIFYPHAEAIHLGGESSKSTRKRMSASGKQLVHLRIKSELRYHRKNFGLRRVLCVSGVELFWTAAIWVKNTVFKDPRSSFKKEEAAATVSLILKTLVADRFGGGTVP